LRGRLDATGCACDAGPATTETAARLASMRCGGRGKLRLTLCVPRTVRNGARLRRSSLDKVCRDNPPPISWSACSHELPMCVRGHMRMGMCVCARVRRKYLFVVLNKVETD
jgi:hypothetical protein